MSYRSKADLDLYHWIHDVIFSTAVDFTPHRPQGRSKLQGAVRCMYVFVVKRSMCMYVYAPREMPSRAARRAHSQAALAVPGTPGYKYAAGRLGYSAR